MALERSFPQFSGQPKIGIAIMAWDVDGAKGQIQAGPGISGCAAPYYDCTGDWFGGLALVMDPTSGDVLKPLVADSFNVGDAYIMPGLIIARDAGGFYAMSSICTHMGCDLALYFHTPKVSLEMIPGAHFITCLCHSAQYDGYGNVTFARSPNQADLPHFEVYIDPVSHQIGVNTFVQVDKDDRF